MSLRSKKCVPCEDGNTQPLPEDMIISLLEEISHWSLSYDKKKLEKEYTFKDFVGALHFVNQVGQIAEIEGHHPDVHIFYNKVRLELQTHSIGALTENDFILAAKIDAIWD